MKCFFKILIYLFLVAFSFSFSYGQAKESDLSCTAQKAFPLGLFNDSHMNGNTITFSHILFLSTKSGIVQSIGLSSFPIRNAITDSNAKVYEALVGYRYKPSKRFYIEFSPGLAIYKRNLNNKNGLLLKLGTGFNLPLKRGGNLNFLQQFCFASNKPYKTYWVSAGLGLSFRIKKRSQNKAL